MNNKISSGRGASATTTCMESMASRSQPSSIGPYSRSNGVPAAPIYDYAEHRRLAETRLVGEHDVIVLEGILIFVDPELRALMDIKLFIDADPDVRLMRRLRRDQALARWTSAKRVDRCAAPGLQWSAEPWSPIPSSTRSTPGSGSRS